jgi:hypothetical protein
MSNKIDGYLYCYAAWPYFYNEDGQRVMYSFDDAVKLATTFNTKVAAKVLASFVGAGTAIHNELPELQSGNEPQVSTILDMVDVGDSK